MKTLRTIPAYCAALLPIKRKRWFGVFVFVLLAGSPAAAEPVTILGFGDSLMAGYGLEQGQSFPAQLERRLAAEGIDARVINAGVSGDTSSGGRARLDWALAGIPGGAPDLVILELGANDALRGIDPAVTRANLDAMLATLADRDIPVLLAGMRAPPNMGPQYVRPFDGLYPELAARYDVVLYPFFLEGVAADPALNQDDGIHPTAEGVAVMVDNILPYVRRALERSARQAAQGPVAR